MNKYQKMLHLSGHSISIITNFGSNHRLVNELRDMVKAGTMEVIDSTYTNHDFYKHPFYNPQSTSTYDKCLDVWLQWDSGIITITTFDGNMVYGDRTNKRNEFKLDGNWFDLVTFREAVEYEFKYYTIRLQEDIEKAEFERKRLILAEQLLAKEIIIEED